MLPRISRFVAALSLVIGSAVLPAIADADAPAINSQPLPMSQSVDACVNRGITALQLAQFLPGNRIAETAYGYRGEYTGRIHCFPNGGGVAIVAGPNTQAVTTYVMQIANGF